MINNPIKSAYYDQYKTKEDFKEMKKKNQESRIKLTNKSVR